jgi:ligand-binding sensor domain-containing protein
MKPLIRHGRLCAWLLLSLFFMVVPGHNGVQAQQWKTYTAKHGLADNTVNAIFQDRDGNMWFGTGSGASRYDGKTWQTHLIVFGLIGNIVTTIFQDREGALWFGTVGVVVYDRGQVIRGGSIYRYDGKAWQVYTTEDGLADNPVYSIFQDRDGALWFGTAIHGVSRYDGKKLEDIHHSRRSGQRNCNRYSPGSG